MFRRRRQDPGLNIGFELGPSEDNSHYWELWQDYEGDSEWENRRIKVRRMRDREEGAGRAKTRRRRDER
jgi:hypothetical protein